MVIHVKNIKHINDESTAKSSASEPGQPTQKDAPLANVDANVGNNAEQIKRLGELFEIINNNGSLELP